MQASLLKDRKTFSFLLFLFLGVLFGIYIFQTKKVTRKNSIIFVKFSKKPPILISDLGKQDKDIILKLKTENNKCFTNEQDKKDINIIKAYLQDQALKIKSTQAKKEVSIKYSKAKELTGREDIKKLVFNFRKCKSENLKKYSSEKRKHLKKTISQLSLNEIIDVYEGIN